MNISKITVKSVDELKAHIRTEIPSFYTSSKTSTVIPYDKLEEWLPGAGDFTMVDLTQIKGEMELLDNGNLIVRGAISWKEAREYLKPLGRNIKTAPTEELALITGGVATSATGERCFHFGNLRSQVKRLKYIDSSGDEKELFYQNKLASDFVPSLDKYQKDFFHYQTYKNAPYPRFETETDLLIGTEGQLGVVTEVEIETAENLDVQHLFILVPKWESDMKAHIELLHKIQNFRNEVIVCEFIDENAFSFLKEEDRPNQGMDAIFLEIKAQDFEKVYEELILDLEHISQDNVFELTESKFHAIRASIPRAVFEENSRMNVVKMGTDVQVDLAHFERLMEIYKEFSKLGLRYNLFGHFGDAHLHFNFMPKPEQLELCQKEFQKLYDKVLEWQGSPFAEHGIGLLKQKYIKKFHGENQHAVFKEMKDKLDPKRLFFPQGFMNA